MLQQAPASQAEWAFEVIDSIPATPANRAMVIFNKSVTAQANRREQDIIDPIERSAQIYIIH
jgi:hypothetical protein